MSIPTAMIDIKIAYIIISLFKKKIPQAKPVNK